MHGRYRAVRAGMGWLVWDTKTGHFVPDSAYGILEMAEAKIESLNHVES